PWTPKRGEECGADDTRACHTPLGRGSRDISYHVMAMYLAARGQWALAAVQKRSLQGRRPPVVLGCQQEPLIRSLVIFWSEEEGVGRAAHVVQPNCQSPIFSGGRQPEFECGGPEAPSFDTFKKSGQHGNTIL
ncbi:hypothetical protein HPB47_001277, partial [Ixodes persulcatus]